MIEQINVTPVGRLTFTLAKLIPYWIIGLAVLTVAMSLAWLVYGLTPVGAVGAVYLAAALFIVTMSGLGVAIANRSDTMQQTMFVMFFFVMIFVLMSGLNYPDRVDARWAQATRGFSRPVISSGSCVRSISKVRRSGNCGAIMRRWPVSPLSLVCRLY